jgi:hypothetical protein
LLFPKDDSNHSADLRRHGGNLRSLHLLEVPLAPWPSLRLLARSHDMNRNEARDILQFSRHLWKKLGGPHGFDWRQLQAALRQARRQAVVRKGQRK